MIYEENGVQKRVMRAQ